MTFKKNSLDESLNIITGYPIVSRETLALSSGIITETTSRAVTSLAGSLESKRISTRRALLLRAVKSTVSGITLASKLKTRVPSSYETSTSVLSEGKVTLAYTMS